jgi:hypothetical protein
MRIKLSDKAEVQASHSLVFRAVWTLQTCPDRVEPCSDGPVEASSPCLIQVGSLLTTVLGFT